MTDDISKNNPDESDILLAEIGDYMSSPVFSVDHDSTVQEAAIYMQASNIGSVLVPVNIDNPLIRQAPKDKVYSKMEELIDLFILVTEGVKPPKGEVYVPVEGANGELGFYLVSDGTGKPLKCRVRPPCFAITQAMPRLCKGLLLADIIPTFDQINLIGGECDR